MHTYDSNPTAGTGADSTTSYEQYIKKAKELGMTSIAFSEHGNTFRWKKKKEAVESAGLKYIHANEVYLTEHLDRDRGLIRDNYHYMLLARNWEGVKELNSLTTKSFNRDDKHFYYNPRITFDELFNTSDNIIMTSACLASPLWRSLKNGNKDILNKFQEFFVQNKHRVFLEIQYHNHPEQIQFNQWLYDFSKNTGIPLIAGTDTHALNKEHQEARKVLLKSKGASYGDEDAFDLTFKSYEELVKMFKAQSAIPEHAFLEAINNTNVMSSMIDEFTLDTTPKYPKMSTDPSEEFKNKIRIGVKERGIHKFDKEKKTKYFKRINEEFDTYKELGAIDYMLLKENIINWCHRNGIFQGYGRGSVNGSIIAYLLKITELDSIKYDLNFTRFLNKDRVTLADIDVDLPPSRRQEVIDYVASLEGINFAEIITFNTMALRGSIENVCRALDIPDQEMESMKDLAEDDYEEFKRKYPEVEKYVRVLKGVVESIGSHASGFLVSPIDLETNVGLCTTKESKYQVSCMDMKELESLNYVKLDLLGLDNIESVNEACKLAGIERLTPDNMNFDDYNVWASIRESTLGVFQWEKENGYRYYIKLFSEETLKNIKEVSPDTSFIDLLSIGNGAIRPAGESYRDSLAIGELHDNGHEELNNFLTPTMGNMIYQEQIIQFLTEFCGYPMTQADIVRRGIAKKGGTEKLTPDIKKGFIKIMTTKYNTSVEKAEELIEYFLKIIEDASGYGFSMNHSYPYSMLGYANAWLRYYYPLEYLTALMNVRRNSKEKIAKIMDYAHKKGIKLKNIKFGKSTALYNLNKEEKAIYKGIKSVAYMNDRISHELYKLAQDNNYDQDKFVVLLRDIIDKTSTDARQMEILIRLDFFSEFGEKEVLLEIYQCMADKKKANFDLYPEFADYTEIVKGKEKVKKIPLKYQSSHIEKTKQQRLDNLHRYEEIVRERKPRKFTPYEEVMFQKEMLGYADYKSNVPKSHCIITEINTKYTPRVTFYQLQTGEEIVAKIKKKTFFSPQGELCSIGDYVEILNTFKDGRWIQKSTPLKKGEFPMYQDMNQLELFVGSLRHI